MARSKQPAARCTGRPKQEKVDVINITAEQLDGLLDRIEQKQLRDDDYGLILNILKSYHYLTVLLQNNRTTLSRLKKLVFGEKTETSKNVLPDQNESLASDPTSSESSDDESSAHDQDGGSTDSKGHGRHGADEYEGAEQVIVNHETLEAGDTCPECGEGKLYEIPPGVVVRVSGQPPITAKVYRMQKLRCITCGHVFSATTPEDAQGDKYDESAAAMIGLLKYGAGMPFNRQQRLEENLGIPLPASTQWDVIHARVSQLRPAYEELIRQAAQWEIFHNDDTVIKILQSLGLKELPGDGEESSQPKRTGTFTSVVVARRDDRAAAIFFSGRQHAGENLQDVLRRRAAELETPIQMCDALSRNVPKELETILGNCLTHARRYFVDVVSDFPEQCRHVIESLKVVYRTDAEAKRRGLSPEKRLKLHRAKSQQTMDRLHRWLEERFSKRLVEPNSGLGQAITYMLKHWEKLTLFLRKAGAPLDNNIAERALKRSILHRKNSLFFKTANGAQVGDLYMTLIHTCDLNGENPFEYLVALMRYSAEVEASPGDWMPWNYREQLERLNPGQTGATSQDYFA